MVTDFLVNMSASADVLAQAKVEVDLSAIPLGKNVSSALVLRPPLFPPRPVCIIARSHRRTYQVIIKWRGKPVFIRHRTPEEIKEAEDTKWETLRDPQPDSDRAKNPEWLIMLGMGFFLDLFSLSLSHIRFFNLRSKRERKTNNKGLNLFFYV